MAKFFFLLLIVNAIALISLSQEVNQPKTDTTKKPYQYLSDVTIIGQQSKTDIHQMPDIVGTSIYAGKKSTLLVLDNVQGNIVNNTMRQVMAKVPGIHIWESDGSGIQIGIATRGLSPNRSWEFNIRQNGYDIAADPFGYPEAYYNPPLQAVQRIEIVRGQGALQYGPQFGGMINYILRNGSEIHKPFQFETQQTVGSNGLFNSYNAIGGETKKIHYYTFFDHRNAAGWRQNSRYYTNTGFGTLTYRLNEKLSLTAEIMRSNMRSQQPGGLLDAQVETNTKQSFRSRNWFDITWTTAALIVNYQFSPQSQLNMKLFTIMGDRNSVGFLPSGGIPIADTINKNTNQYNPRNLNADQYRNIGMEVRYLGEYKFLHTKNIISVGGRLYKGNTHRYAADNKGTTGTDYDMTLSDGVWTRDIDFNTINAAVFAENMFRVGKKLLIIPGLRYEYISGDASGRNGFSGTSEILLQPQHKSRGFVLLGIGSEYPITATTKLYANITEAFRPVQFADLTAPPSSDIIDENLKDAKGYNADLGYRGKIGNYIFFDISAYYLQYNNRIGVIVQQRGDGSFYNYRTNVGNSRSKGLESLIEFSPVKAFTKNRSWGDINFFVSYSYTDARYEDFKVITKNSSNQLIESNLKNKRIENAPEHMLRTGLTYSYKGLILTGQLSWVDKTYADANNTVTPSANAQNGLIPAYKVADLTATYHFSKQLNIKAGINNLTDERYFTRRAGGYPGPGALPADGRTFFVSVAAIF